ncbi:MAG TPA: hypothetical protein VKQ32_17050 [Polyangia bacterium]|nr:hypothetical protein [Polyangia bacterium]
MRSTTTVRDEIVGVGLLWAALAALPGCGGPASGATAAAAAACMQLHAASAARSARCSGGMVADWQANIDSQEDCAAYTRHVADHQVEYRPQNLAACLAEYDRSCDEVPTVCAYDVLHGLVSDGQPCQDNEVCGTTSVCFPIGGDTCGGQVCGRLAAENESCGLWCGGTAPCGAIAVCAGDLVCVNTVCVKSKGIGESCGPADPTTCSSLLACSADPADPQATGTCQAKTAGGPCHVDLDCPAAQYCAQGTCTPRRPLGANCADAPNGCATWNKCDDATATCILAGRPGQPCAPYPQQPDYTVCIVGFCLQTNNSANCLPYPSPGGSCPTTVCTASGDCETVVVCAPGYSCDVPTMTCVACP